MLGYLGAAVVGTAGKFRALQSIVSVQRGVRFSLVLTEPFFSCNWSSAHVWLLGLIITEYDRREKSSCSQLLLSGKFETLFEAML